MIRLDNILGRSIVLSEKGGTGNSGAASRSSTGRFERTNSTGKFVMTQGPLRQFPLSQFHQFFPECFRWCSPTKALSWGSVEAVANRPHIAI